MYSWVSSVHGIPSIQDSPIDKEFPPDTEFPPGHGISPSTRNSPLDTDGIPPLTWNSPLTWSSSLNKELLRHGIPPNFFYFHIFSMLCYAIYFLPNSDGIPWNSAEFRGFLRASQYIMFEFEYFQCKFVRIKSRISGLAEVKSASFFLVR
jgi:hypothetical protein